MNGKFLLDTNIVIAILADDPLLRKRLKGEIEVVVPTIVVGELFYGAYHSARPQENLQRIEAFCLDVSILRPNFETGRWYGLIKSNLRNKGRPIPDNDIWIGALARQFQLPIVSRDDHFSAIGEIDWQKW